MVWTAVPYTDPEIEGSQSAGNLKRLMAYTLAHKDLQREDKRAHLQSDKGRKIGSALGEIESFKF